MPGGAGDGGRGARCLPGGGSGGGRAACGERGGGRAACREGGRGGAGGRGRAACRERGRGARGREGRAACREGWRERARERGAGPGGGARPAGRGRGLPAGGRGAARGAGSPLGGGPGPTRPACSPRRPSRRCGGRRAPGTWARGPSPPAAVRTRLTPGAPSRARDVPSHALAQAPEDPRRAWTQPFPSMTTAETSHNQAGWLRFKLKMTASHFLAIW
ncbi:hypothetical protein VULLAG_LOCUS784 [Vulpes lagopus]